MVALWLFSTATVALCYVTTYFISFIRGTTGSIGLIAHQSLLWLLRGTHEFIKRPLVPLVLIGSDRVDPIMALSLIHF